MSTLEWQRPKRKRRAKFRTILSDVREQQTIHPGQWAEISRYANPASGRDAATRLRKEYPDFRFESYTDQDTRQGVVRAMYVGGG